MYVLTRLLTTLQAYLSKFQCEKNAAGQVTVSYTTSGGLAPLTLAVALALALTLTTTMTLILL